jgi:hypothetical protein
MWCSMLYSYTVCTSVYSHSSILYTKQSMIWYVTSDYTLDHRAAAVAAQRWHLLSWEKFLHRNWELRSVIELLCKETAFLSLVDAYMWHTRLHWQRERDPRSLASPLKITRTIPFCCIAKHQPRGFFCHKHYTLYITHGSVRTHKSSCFERGAASGMLHQIAASTTTVLPVAHKVVIIDDLTWKVSAQKLRSPFIWSWASLHSTGLHHQLITCKKWRCILYWLKLMWHAQLHWHSCNCSGRDTNCRWM